MTRPLTASAYNFRVAQGVTKLRKMHRGDRRKRSDYTRLPGARLRPHVVRGASMAGVKFCNKNSLDGTCTRDPNMNLIIQYGLLGLVLGLGLGLGFILYCRIWRPLALPYMCPQPNPTLALTPTHMHILCNVIYRFNLDLAIVPRNRYLPSQPQ